jgi:hypothetical protein
LKRGFKRERRKEKRKRDSKRIKEKGEVRREERGKEMRGRVCKEKMEPKGNCTGIRPCIHTFVHT